MAIVHTLRDTHHSRVVTCNNINKRSDYSMIELKFSQQKIVTKGSLILTQGEIANFTFMVKSGCLKSFVIDQTGKEHILQFAPEGWLIGDMDSSTNLIPSNIFIDAVEDSEIVLISTSQFADYHNLEKALVTEMSIKLRNNLIATNKRIISLLSATAEQRYIEFTKTYPTLVQRLPLKLIASYIGITPEYLSEVRRKIAKNRA